jgi:superfamily II DNA or RNA helicase
MLTKVDWPYSRSYKSGSENEPIEFYLTAFSNSKSVDLLLGYFSFSAINVLAIGFTQFLANGGKMRVVANNILSKKDKETILKAEEPGPNDGLIDLEDIRILRYVLDDYGKHFFECMAWLIKNQRIEIVLVKPKETLGIAHYKAGIFDDGENQVMFSGSCNFTAYGMVENLERLDAYLSWENSRSSKKIAELKQDFESLFTKTDRSVDYIPVKEVEEAILSEYGNKDLQQLLTSQVDLLRMRKKLSASKRLSKLLKETEEHLEDLASKPRFPYASGPRDYQKEAYKNWVANDYKGIFAMATGTGKTLTSLNCLLNEFTKSGTYKAVIIVPTIALVKQWKKECHKFNFKNIITVSSREKWDNKISFFNTASRFTSTSFIIIITYASFHRKKFQAYFQNLDKNTLLIADEAHNLGAGKVAKTLKTIHLQKRIGLSATINRKYDDEGNKLIQEFFNDKPPYVIEYSMKLALEKGVLCQYKYYPHLVELDSDELNQYAEISKRLMRYFDSATGTYKKAPEVEMLLLMRKRIIHKAKNKLPVFQKILKEEFAERGNLHYTLIYVPEGKDPEYDILDEHAEDEEDAKLIHEYTRAVSDVDFSVMVKQYTSSIKGRDAILEDFEEGKLHVLTSMKCLDEGVDVPRSELAIFCASTGNPRQFIQRRGRVLRTHDDKSMAIIHDLVVIPRIDPYSEQYNMERTMVKKELERVVDFSFLALNKMDTFEALESTLQYYNLNLFDINDQLTQSNE